MMDHASRVPRVAVPTSDRLTAAAMDIAAVLTVGYWADYFTKGRVRSSDDPSYIAFQNAFPVADSYLVLCLACGARALRRQRPSAVMWGIAAGSAMVYLAAMDTLYNLENGKYSDRTAEMAVEATINAATWILGPVVMRHAWRARARLVPS